MYGAKEILDDEDFSEMYRTEPSEWLFRDADISAWPDEREMQDDADNEY